MIPSSAATRPRTPHALRVLLVLGHPRRDSLCGALADAYCDGAGDAGVELRRIDLAALSFARDVTAASPENQPLEPDLQAAHADLTWAEHLVFVYPTWWGTMPALLKSFLDRLVMPGFAFRFYGPGAAEWEGLWPDKSAQLITTMDTPPPVYRWLFHAPGTPTPCATPRSASAACARPARWCSARCAPRMPTAAPPGWRRRAAPASPCAAACARRRGARPRESAPGWPPCDCSSTP
nr:NAD(P)H-dependent oxidoreductase [Salinisphaera orenii]